ncbi:cytochrome b/b6 domain-containing protein [Rhodoferax antarcticus]|uniref:Cytochrome b561 family protein n=1 Tax=Rhodoferax antarcticus ANT.BR TaxID=1111071 RepID=A0A1Q8YIY0_9BURK|nr:cytochrome b/b6 domain-containing protein [Rhodoferax antarcticus]APW48579.1 cytochrome B [Rhodoferax antarcticus]MCW2313921.1 cytochrome b [Rhodoferax antarcticus]OLP07879.1 cytochrome b561 family protein [Rhodoferax antarcticus ANT.BR]
MLRKIRVWDAPTRLFHWSLTVAVIALVITANLGGTAMEWHFWLGYAVLALLLFRLVWGVLGGHWSRFSAFVYSPKEVVNYLRGKSIPKDRIGHNPVGALSVYAFLVMLTLQGFSGLFSDDEIFTTGPFAHLVSGEWVSNATWYHKDIGQYILMALIALHVTAIMFYLFKKKQNLIKPMLTGDKLLDFPAPSSSDKTSDRIKALVILAISAGIIVGALQWFG